jgi:hypothetical protein
MAYDFLGLVNDVNKKLNEVNLTSVNFADAGGFYSDVKNAVNNSIRQINTQEFNWPFNHVTKNLVLTPEVVRYNYEADAKSVSFNTFRIRGDNTLGNNTTGLFPIDYEEYLAKFSDMEYRPSNYKSIPRNVFRTPEMKFGIFPPPDKAYTLDYEYYMLPVELDLWDDAPTIPEMFRYVIFSGAMIEGYLFRGDKEASAMAAKNFVDGIDDMRKILINRLEYARSTQIIR